MSRILIIIGVLLLVNSTTSHAEQQNWQTLAQTAITQGKQSEAEDICRGQAETGNTHAMEVLARILLANNESSHQKEALQWIEKSAEQGSVRALEWLGEIYILGAIGTNKNPAKAHDYLQEAQKHPSAVEAYFWLGKMAAEGIGREKSLREAVDLMRKAEKAGSILATTSLARLYMTQNAVTPDYQEAYRLALKASRNGHAEAYYLLGLLAEQHYPKPINPQIALSHFQKAADLGYTEALIKIALLTLEKNPSQPKLAHPYFLRAATNGNITAILSVADFYRNSSASYFDPVAAEAWLKKAIPSKHPKALNDYGMLLYKGIGVKTSQKEAQRLFQQSADIGYPPAMVNLAATLLSQQPEEAKNYLEKAAALNYTPSFSVLGNYYESRIQNNQTAILEATYWYSRAAKHTPIFSKHSETLKKKLNPSQLTTLEARLIENPSQ